MTAHASKGKLAGARALVPNGAGPRPGRQGIRPPADFAAIAAAALSVLPAILQRWLPGGHREGHEWVALNPTRVDHHLGSFRINLETGRWADFATDDRGGDPISLLAYLNNCSQLEAARDLAAMLGLRTTEIRHDS